VCSAVSLTWFDRKAIHHPTAEPETAFWRREYLSRKWSRDAGISSKPITFIIMRTLTMVVVSVLLGRIEIGSEPVRDEHYPGLWVPRPKQRV
jgi:hypothetical protein